MRRNQTSVHAGRKTEGTQAGPAIVKNLTDLCGAGRFAAAEKKAKKL